MNSADHSDVDRPVLRLVTRISTGCIASLLVIAWGGSSINDSTYAVSVKNHPHEATFGFDRSGWFWSRAHSPGVFLTPSAVPRGTEFQSFRRTGHFLQYYSFATPTAGWNWFGVSYHRYTDPFSTTSVVYLSHYAVLTVVVLMLAALLLFRRRARNRRPGHAGTVRCEP
jgi:hypothetical protein